MRSDEHAGRGPRFALALWAALFPIACLLVAAMLARTTAYLGAQIDHRGQIIVLQADGPAARAGLATGDTIVAINGSPPQHAWARLTPEANALVVVQRGTEHQSVVLSPTTLPAAQRWRSAWPLLTALVFWAAGLRLLLGLHRPTDSARWFTIYAFVSATTILAGRLRANELLSEALFLTLAVAQLVSLLQFHCRFPMAITAGRLLRAITWQQWSGLTLLGVGLLLGGSTWWIALPTAIAMFEVVVFAYDVLTTILIILILGYGYRIGRTRQVRSRIRLIVSAGVVVFLLRACALASLFIAPHWAAWPTSIAPLSQALIPLAYLVALRREDFSTVDLALNRAFVYTLVVVILIGLQWSIIFALMLLLGRWISASLLVHAAIGAALAVLFAPLRDRVRHTINLLFYGRDGDLRQTGQRLARDLARSRDEAALVQILGQRLPRLLDASGYTLLLWRNEQGWSCHAAAGVTLPAASAEALGLVASRLVERPVVRAVELRRLAAVAALDPGTLPSSGVTICFANESCARAVLWLGPKASGEAYTEQELELLRLLVPPGVLALENIALNRALALRNTELQYLHHALIMADDRVRQQLAHELHDSILQDVYGVLYTLQTYPHEAAPATYQQRLQGLLEKVVDDLRRLCHGLRPPLLDELGLAPALRALVREYADTVKSRIHLEGEIDDLPLRLPAAVESGLFAIAKSALSNVVRHSQASQAWLRLELEDGVVSLDVWDNGLGFTVPCDWTELLQAQRFGLASMRERAHMLQASFSVISSSGLGTRVRVQWTLPPALQTAHGSLHAVQAQSDAARPAMP